METGDKKPSSYVVVLLRGGGFRPCVVTEYRARLGSEIIKRINRSKDAYQSYSLAEAEAQDMADLYGLSFRRL